LASEESSPITFEVHLRKQSSVSTPIQTWRKIIAILSSMSAVDTLTAAIGFVVGPLLVAHLTGSYRWSGLPGTVLLFSGALATFAVRKSLDQYGYRLVLGIAVLIQSIGSILVLAGDAKQNLILVLSGFVLWGAGRGVLGLSRYAAGEISPSAQRGRAIGLVVFGGAVGALLAPSVLKFSHRIFDSSAWGDNSGPLIVAALLFAISGIVDLLFLFPEPKHFRLQPSNVNSGVTQGVASPSPEKLEYEINRGLGFGMVSMIIGHIVMVFIMTITPVYMKSCHYALDGITWVISIHIFGMFGFSFVNGWLIDKFGNVLGIVSGCLILLSSSLLSGYSTNYAALLLGLFLLGYGWNFCFLAGSKLIVSYGASRGLSKIQGLNDSLLYFGAGIASLGSGFVFQSFSFVAMAWLGVILSLIPLAYLVFWLKPVKTPNG
jgi:MFS family permease